MRDDNRMYYIKRIRLINFHNFINETIEIKDGGHLFILGDNGSGKTTLLDAVHYVLTAGEHLELNSAARIAGSRAGGRRMQDIITRYNIDKGHMNKNGGITYAALELVNRQNSKSAVVAVGMMVNSPNDNLNRWGIVCSGRLEEIPFILEDENGRRPRTGREMRKEIGNTHCFLQMQRYQNVIADRFFGGIEQFNEFSRFLKIGKAYREIAAQSTDYHDLFKKLLPTPGVERFERVIDSLKSLDESRGEIEGLKSKRNYIAGLVDLVNEIKIKDKLIVALKCLIIEFETEELNETIGLKKRKILKNENKIQLISDSIAEFEKKRKHYSELLDDYKQKDSSGLLREEKNLKERILELNNIIIETNAVLKNKKSQMNKIEAMISALHSAAVQGIKKNYLLLSELAPSLIFPTGRLIASLEESIHLETCKELCQSVSEIDSTSFEEVLLDNKVNIENKLSENEKSALYNKNELKKISDEIQKLKNTDEAVPFIDNFKDACDTLKSNMISFKPMYLGLEWNSGVSQSEIDFLETFIGEEILSSIIIDSRDFEKASEVIINEEFAGIRLISTETVNSTKSDISNWIRKYFSISACDSSCIKALSIEMDSLFEPDFDFDRSILFFRAHKGYLSSGEAFLIGEKNRKLKIIKQIKTLEEDKEVFAEALGELISIKKKLIVKKENLNKFDGILKNISRGFGNFIVQSTDCFTKLEHCIEITDEKQKQLADFKNQHERTDLRLREIQKLISDEEIFDLQDKMKDVSGKIKMTEAELDALKVNKGQFTQRLEQDQIFIKESFVKLDEIKIRFNDAAGKFKQQYSEIGNVSEYCKELRHVNKISSTDKCRVVVRKADNGKIEDKTVLIERINNKEFSSVYAFTYNEETNTLFDRNNRAIADILSNYELNIKDIEEVINERTGELFQKIIMDDLIRFLIERVGHVEDMERKINRILNRRSFGSNRYSLKIRPNEDYKSFVKIIKNFSLINEDSKNELKDFIDYYKDRIIGTEPGEIPEMLDYRNWFSYDMVVNTADSDGKVLNKYIKNIGSGGEQAVPNYLLILTIAHFIYNGSKIRLPVLLFDEAFYGIDAGRRDQLMGFAGDIGLQIFIATPDQDGVRKEIMYSTSLFVKKDKDYNIFIQPVHWTNPDSDTQGKLGFIEEEESIQIGEVQ